MRLEIATIALAAVGVLAAQAASAYELCVDSDWYGEIHVRLDPTNRGAPYLFTFANGHAPCIASVAWGSVKAGTNASDLKDCGFGVPYDHGQRATVVVTRRHPGFPGAPMIESCSNR